MTARLSFCLKAATTLSDRDVASLTDAIEAYVHAGMDVTQAETVAVNDLLAIVATDRSEVVDLLKAQHAPLFSADRPALPKKADDLGAMFDDLMAEQTKPPAPPQGAPRQPTPLQAPTRTATQAASSAAANTGKALGNAIDGLGALFGTKPGGGTLGMGGAFSEETYAQAKPLFVAALANMKDAAADLREAMRTVIQMVVGKFGAEVAQNMKPYVVRFVTDVRDGKVDLQAPQEDTGANGPLDTGAPGADTLDEVAPPEGGGPEGEGAAGPGGPGSGVTGAKSDRRSDVPGVSGTRSGGSGSTSVRAPSPRGGRGRKSGRKGGTGVDAGPVPAGDGRTRLTPVSVPNLPAVNFRITPDVRLGKGGEVEKFNDNVAAIRALKAIEAENRRATPDEQRVLARYVGWGGLANAFPDHETKQFKPDWKDRGPELKSLLTDKEYQLARRSTLDAHFTSEVVVSGMWDAARQLGFKGGMAIESSGGIGNILGLMPDTLVGNTRFVSVEYDSITARMSQLLYPQETVLNAGFQNVPLPDGQFDLNIGNPPFGDQSLRFQYKPELNGASIHNQFIRAALDAVKPGGLQIQVVSRFLMDKVDTSDRAAIARHARLLGAIRLPDTAFKENARTEVVTDILFFQRLTEAEESEMAEAFTAANTRPEKKDTDELARQRLAAKVPSWVQIGKVADPLGGEHIPVNSYFVKNPHMILGSLERSGLMQFKNDITVRFEKGADFKGALADAIAQLPSDVLVQEPDAIARSLEQFKLLSDALRIALAGHERGSITIDADGKLSQVVERENANGDFLLARRDLTAASPWADTLIQRADGGWYQVSVKTDAEGKPVKQMKGGKVTNLNVYEKTDFAKESDIPASLLLGPARLERLRRMVGLRDLFVRQINLETEDAPSPAMEGNRAKLAAAYANFTKAHGWISEPSNAALVSNMPDGALVQALELSYKPAISAARAKTIGEQPRDATAEPAPILRQRVIPKYEPPTRAATAADALTISMSESGRIDLERMAALLGVPEEEVTAQLHDRMDDPLIFRNPETNTWEPRSVYLSGQVRRKMIAARAAGMEKNTTQLERVQPEPVGAENVTVLLGSTWVPPATYADFFTHMTGQQPHISFSEVTNSYAVRMPSESSAALNDRWGAEGMRVESIIEHLINTAPIRVYDHTDDGPRVNVTKTEIAQLRAKAIENAFADWVFADGPRRDALVSTFNEKFNTRVTRQHDGSHLILPGKVPDAILKMRRHQKNAIWRGIAERFTLYDHVVGAGKTYTAIARAMERRRMGLSRKPMIVVPNHLVEEWTNSVYRLYPGAKVLAAGKGDFEKKNRRKIFAKIASGDWDIVIVPHSSFGFIGISSDTAQRYLEGELVAAEKAIKEAWDASEQPEGAFRKPFTVKAAERLRDKLVARMDRIKGREKADRLLTFEQMGVDDLTVDEAHEFKNLFYSSRLTDVKGMGNASGSQKAFDLYNKVRVLRESPTGSVTFMTGTPISNSAVEMYNMMRYLAAQELKELGLEHFDAFRAQFVSTDPGWEANETGRLKEVNRLGRTWSNMRSLMDLYYSFTDSVSNDDIKSAYAEDNQGQQFPIPKVKGGERQSVIIQPTEAQDALLKDIIHGFDNLPGIADPYQRNIERLKLMDRARKVSLDARAAEPGHESTEKGGKLERVATEVKRIYDKWTPDRGTQLLFLDRSVPKARGDAKVLKEYDALVASRDAALAARDEEGYRKANDKLEAYNKNEIDAMRAAQSGGWNAYQQIKDNLVAMGVPANEIRFIQEATNDAQKQAMFDAVNDGTVRILIGSSQRMGAGTNVQQRLVGLHHVDVTWKPSDIEQREGRIIRQGNTLVAKYGIDTFEVEILAYAVERTIDAKMWQLNSAKLRTINGIRKYDGAFSMEFEDEESVSMAEMAALASGDPLLLERVKLDSEIRKLELLEEAHRRKQWGTQSRIDQYRKQIKTLPAQIAATEKRAAEINEVMAALKERAATRRVTVEGTEFSSGVEAVAAAEAAKKLQQGDNDKARYAITIDGKRYTSQDGIHGAVSAALGDFSPFEATIRGQNFIQRSEAAKAIAKIASEEAATLGAGAQVQIELGTFAGLEFDGDVSLNAGGNLYQVEFTLTGKDGKTVKALGAPLRTDADFTGQSLVNTLGSLDLTEQKPESASAWDRQMLELAKQELPTLEERSGSTFQQSDLLEAKRARLIELTNQLSGKVVAGMDPRDVEAALWDIANPTGWPNVPNVSFSLSEDFEDTVQLPEVIAEGPVSDQDARDLARAAKAFEGVPKLQGLKLTVLPRVPKPRPGDSDAAQARYAAVEAAENLLGKRVIFFSSNRSFANGFHSHAVKDAIFVNEAATRPIEAVIGHELLHSLRAQHPDLYDRLKARLDGMLKNPDEYMQALQARRRRNNLPDLTEGKLSEELIADIVGDNFTDPVFWRRLAFGQPTLFVRVISAIREFFDTLLTKLRNQRPYGTDRYLNDVAAARDAVSDVLRAFVERKGATDTLARAGAELSIPNEPFYSELAHQIEVVPMNGGSVEAWRNFLKSLPQKGVKADEIAWTGIDDWLQLQTGRVTRTQVLDYLNANGVKVTETVLGGLPLGAWNVVDADGQEYGPFTSQQEAKAWESRTRQSWESMRRVTFAKDESPDTKFAQYQLPGGTNYREVLLTLPSKASVGRKAIFDEYQPRIDAAYKVLDAARGLDARDKAQTELERLQDERNARADKEAGVVGKDTFKSGHWDQPNVLAHIRLNDRTYADGKRVLFVEEIQSDWGQAGKKKGFADPAKKRVAVKKSTGDQETVARFATADEAQAYIDAHPGDRLTSWVLPADDGPPSAPFVGKTDAWVALALKRVVKMAVDGGYDRVAFVTGEQSAERYSLSKQVHSIKWEPYSNGTTLVSVFVPDQNALQLAVDKTGKVESARGPGFAGMEGKGLDDIIGKEVAKRILEAPKGELAGEGLNIGGEGMKAFYDKIVPSVAKEVLKKVGGGKLTTVNIGAELDGIQAAGGATGVRVAQNTSGQFIIVDEAGQRADMQSFGTMAEAEAAIKESQPNISRTTQPGFDITPEMREKAAGGLPMFSLRDDHTDVEREALRRAGINTQSRLQRAGDKIRSAYPRALAALASNWGRQFQQGYLDQFTGQLLAEERELGGLPTEQSAYIAMRLANGGASSVMRGLLLHGQAQWAANGQHLEKIPDTKGLLDILAPLGDDLNDFFGWMIGNRAARLMTEGRENNFTPEQIKALQGLGKGKEDKFRAAALGYAAFKRSVLDIAEEAGLIKGEGRKIWDLADYIPFYREIDEKAVFSATGKKGLSGQSSGIRTLRGGESALNDPMENIIMNFSRLIDASLKNNAIRKSVEVLKDTGIIGKVGYSMSREIIPASEVRKQLEAAGTPDVVMDVIPPEAFDGMAKMWALQQPTDPAVVRIMVDGKPQFYRVNDPLLLKALTSFVPFDFPGLGVARAFKRLLTATVTATPEFMIANFIRDSVASQLLGRTGFNPGKSIAGIVKSYTEAGGFEDMLFAGASFQSGQINAGDAAGTGVAVRRALRKKGFSGASANEFMASILDTPAKFWEKYRHVGESIENANRDAIFEATLRRTNSVTAAAYESKDIMDFTLRGSSPIYQVMADVLPFFNARVQGLYRLGRADPKRLVAYGMLMVAASVALALANSGNDDYDKLPDWDKDTYWHIWIRGMHFRIPKPFELGVAFATIPERVLRYIFSYEGANKWAAKMLGVEGPLGSDTGKKALSRIYVNIRDQLAFDPVPQVIRPAANALANKDTFRDRPIEGTSDEGKLPSMRYSGSTSPTARMAVQAIAPVADEIGLSPKKLEYLVNGYLGTAGLYALGLSDRAVRAFTNAPPQPATRLDELPVIRRFYRQEPAVATVFESDLYNLRTEVDKVYQSVKALRREGQEEAADALEAKNESKLDVRKHVDRTATRLARLNRQREEIYASRDMTPVQKREALDEILRERADLTREVMKEPEVIKATQ